MSQLLTPYDEFPVHQAPCTFSHIPSTDYNWDDGYYFGVFSPAEKTFLAIGLRVNPNTDMVGGYALLNLAGQQLTARFSRCWRGNYGLTIGPLSIQIVEPLRTIRLKLLDNESGLAFDILWEGVSPPYLEEHHLSVTRGRRNTDQTRYSQAGKASGVIVLRDRVFDLQSSDWYAARDHSWGLYAGRPPLSPPASLLPPVRKEGPHC